GRPEGPTAAAARAGRPEPNPLRYRAETLSADEAASAVSQRAAGTAVAMNPAGNDIQFSKVRLEILCDVIFTVARTLLVLELKVPDLPWEAAPQEILHALGQHILSFVGFGMTFALAGGFWIAHHIAFSYIRRVNAALTVLTIPS